MKREESLIRREIDAEFAFLDNRPSLYHDIMREIKGEKIVKKKISVGLVLALALMLLSAVALAYTLSQQYFEDVAQLQFDSGYYDDWDWPEKQRMVEILEEYGLITPSQADAMTDEAAVDAYMGARYGIDGRTDVIGLWGILEKELGHISTWTLEQKAWYTEMQIEIGLLTKENDDYICALPEKDDLQPEAAIEIAKAAIIEAYGLTADALDAYRVDVAFETHASDWERENLHYNINFWGEFQSVYFCAVTRDGRIMDSSMNEWIMSPAEQAAFDKEQKEKQAAYQMQQPEGTAEGWSLEDKAKYLDGENALPRESDITQEKAVEIALQRFRDIGYDLTEYDMDVWYKLRDAYGTDERLSQPFYVIYFAKDLEIFSMIIDAADGEILQEYTPGTMPQNG